MTKADYDELVRLRDAGCAEVIRVPTINPKQEVDANRFSGALSNAIGEMKYGDTLNIAAAIAEYERAQEGKSDTDASKPV